MEIRVIYFKFLNTASVEFIDSLKFLSSYWICKKFSLMMKNIDLRLNSKPTQ